MAEEKGKPKRGKKPVAKTTPEPSAEPVYEEIQNEVPLDIPQFEWLNEPLQGPLFHEIKPEGQQDILDTEASPELPEDVLPSNGQMHPPTVMGRVHGVRGEPDRTPGPPDSNEPPTIKAKGR